MVQWHKLRNVYEALFSAASGASGGGILHNVSASGIVHSHDGYRMVLARSDGNHVLASQTL